MYNTVKNPFVAISVQNLQMYVNSFVQSCVWHINFYTFHILKQKFHSARKWLKHLKTFFEIYDLSQSIQH